MAEWVEHGYLAYKFTIVFLQPFIKLLKIPVMTKNVGPTIGDGADQNWTDFDLHKNLKFLLKYRYGTSPFII